MNMTQLYYEAPSDEVFEEVKQKSMELWIAEYPEETSPFYAKEKVSEIENLRNIQDNVMSIVARFDGHNMVKLANKLSPEARLSIRERMMDGGSPEFLIPF